LEEKDRQIAEKDKQIIALTETLQDEKNGFATPAVKQRRADEININIDDIAQGGNRP
jgi:hypothetical protein